MLVAGNTNSAMRPAIRNFDWSSTSIGPVDAWPATLHTVLGLVLDNEFSMNIMWGPDFIQLYNDGYMAILADKHPRSMGQPAAICWAEIWNDVGPLLRGVYERGEPLFIENMPLLLTRYGRLEQTYFTFSYTPIRDGDEICGILLVVYETTAHVRREGALRESEERFRMLAASLPHIVLETDCGGHVTFISEAYSRFTGEAAASGHGLGWIVSIHPEDAGPVLNAWQNAIAMREAFVAEFRYRREDGAYRWHSARLLPHMDADGAPVRWKGTLTDTHDSRRAGEEREVLSEASRLLSESLDRQTTLQSIAQLIVPSFADWCQIDLRTSDGRIETAAIVHSEPEKNELAQGFVGRIHLDPNAERGNAYAIRTGLSDFLEDLPLGTLAAAVADDAETTAYTILGTRSFASIPLIVRGETIGAIGAVFGDSGRRYSVDDLPILEELGRRAALAVQNATDFERQHRVADSFQQASLPTKLPEVHGLTFDAVYLPGSDEAQVGGDWYDAVRLFDGRVLLSIGDVAGSGLNAAVRMGNMRQIIRGIAQVHADPALMLDAADRALRLEYPDEYVTAFVGVLDPISNILAYASAGHPPPLLRYLDGRVESLSDGGLPLGLRHERIPANGATVDIARASALVLYTDGLSEAFRDPVAGEQRLRNALSDGAVLSAPYPAQALMGECLTEGPALDDVAILVIGIALHQAPVSAALPPIQQWSFDVADTDAAQAARHEFSQALSAFGMTAEDAFSAELVFGELVGNVVRYAFGPVRVVIDLSAASPVLHVLDCGPGFRHTALLPADIYSESGRGLFLVSALTTDFQVARRPTGGSHARAVLGIQRARLLSAPTPD